MQEINNNCPALNWTISAEGNWEGLWYENRRKLSVREKMCGSLKIWQVRNSTRKSESGYRPVTVGPAILFSLLTRS